MREEPIDPTKRPRVRMLVPCLAGLGLLAGGQASSAWWLLVLGMVPVFLYLVMRKPCRVSAHLEEAPALENCVDTAAPLERDIAETGTRVLLPRRRAPASASQGVGESTRLELPRGERKRPRLPQASRQSSSRRFPRA